MGATVGSTSGAARALSPRASGIYASALGLIWITLAAVKAASPTQFVAFISAHHVHASFAWVVICAEAIHGCCLVFIRSSRARRVGGGVTLMAVFGMFALGVLMGGDGSSACGCFGNVARATWGRRLVVMGAQALLATQLLLSLRSASAPGSGGATEAIR